MIPEDFRPTCPCCNAPMVEVTTSADASKGERVFVYGWHNKGCTIPSDAAPRATFRQGVAFEWNGHSFVEASLWRHA
jgi:hypothetical protein